MASLPNTYSGISLMNMKTNPLKKFYLASVEVRALHCEQSLLVPSLRVVEQDKRGLQKFPVALMSYFPIPT